MARVISEALTATGMSLISRCDGMSYVGIGITGTWVGTIQFFGSFDGVTFIPIQVIPFASGTAVLTATANGSWFVPVGVYVAVKAVFVRTSGTAIVKMAASLDSSFQDAYLAPSTVFINQKVTHASNALAIALQANRSWRIRTLNVTVIGGAVTWASSPNLKITDGASNILFAMDLPTTNGAIYSIPLPEDPGTPGVNGGGVNTTPGNGSIITVVDGGVGVITNINAEVRAA